ncbi:MAG: S-adenosylmethionine:tRNA ribosyltransferase-isomerase [Acidimicrobiales bacterium]
MTTALGPAVPAAPAFDLPPELIATAPVEHAGGRRDDARLLVGWRSGRPLVHTRFRHLAELLGPGDVLVVNTSATLPAAVPARVLDAGAGHAEDLLVHFSTELADGRWAVELRRACGAGSLPFDRGRVGLRLELGGGSGRADLVAAYPAGTTSPARLWIAALDLAAPAPAYLAATGRPIRYGCTARAWPLAAYQTVFALHPGSAEMPSAARAFTPELVTALVARGVTVAPLVLHTGVSSQEAGELPYPERYRVPATTAAVVNDARRRGHRVVAVGTTATRALESAADATGRVRAASGRTEVVVTPERGVQAVDGLLTGWHEPTASHLKLLEAVAGRPLLERSYAAALAGGYRWHEFGDLHLVLP